jgi:PAS domain S-box-containing protein
MPPLKALQTSPRNRRENAAPLRPGQRLALLSNSPRGRSGRALEAELQLTKAFLGYLLNATPVVIFALSRGPHPRITFVSDNVFTEFGYRKEEVTGKDRFWAEHIHPGDASMLVAALHAIRPGRPATLEYRLLHRDGAYRDVRTEFTLPAGPYQAEGLVGFWLDVTERKRVDAALLATLECGESVIRAASESELLESVCQAIVKMGGYRMAWVALPQPGAGKRMLPVAKAGAGKDYVEKVKVSWAEDEPTGQGPMGRAVRTKTPVVCRDIANDPRFAPWRREALRRGYASVIALPLLWRNECLGAISIYSDQQVAFHRQEAELLQKLADDLAYGLTALRGRMERERLQRELLAISEREQRRIAQDLHDGLCQQLLGAAFIADGIQRRLSRDNDLEARAAERLAETLRESVRDARALSHGVHPVDSAPGALAKALEDFAGVTGRIFGIDCRFVCARPIVIANHGCAVHLYRIAQEAVGNAIKHSRCDHVTISLRRDRSGALLLSIRDNGSGMPAAPVSSDGMGLRIMRYRASMCGGVVTIRRSRGTTVTCRIPRRSHG